MKELFVQETLVHPTSKQEIIKMYVTRWCGDCRMAKRWFDSRGIPYEYINIEEDDNAAAYVAKVNGGMHSVPTIVFPDGSILVEPGPRELAAKFSK
jgi:mycoredoxin